MIIVAREHATITMTVDEIAAFVAVQDMCILATVDEDGAPWGDAVACASTGDFLYFSVPAATRSRGNLRSDPRVCCTLESKGADYYSVKAVMVHGEASLVTDAADLPPGLGKVLDPVTRQPVENGVNFRLDLEHVVSFDFAKIQRRFDQ